MDMHLIYNIIGILASSGVLAALMKWLEQRRHDKTMDPITRETAALSAAETALNISRGTIDRLDERVQSLEKKLCDNEDKMDKFERRLAMVVLPYVERLRQHIINGNPPPPPDFPPGWHDYEEN